MIKTKTFRLLCTLLAVAALGCASAQHHDFVAHPSANFSLKSVTSSIIPPVDPTKTFLVRFQGIICQATFSRDGGSTWVRRAIVIQGTPIKIVKGSPMPMVHHPQLIFDRVDLQDGTGALDSKVVTSIRDASGQTVNCNVDVCWIDLDAIAFRIVDSGDLKNPLSGYATPVDFCLLPSLGFEGIPKGGKGRGMNPIFMEDAVAQGPAAAYFEIAGSSMLTAYAFPPKPHGDTSAYHPGGRFPTDAYCRKFGQYVDWEGSTTNAPRLQIRSDKTLGKWQTITLNNSDRLGLRVVNEPDGQSRSGTPPAARFSAEHFILHEKLLPSAQLPELTLCDDPTVCLSVQSAGAHVAVPGCSDTQWP